MRFFIAGVMQGSSLGTDLHDQAYRTTIARHLQEGFPGADVYDPWEEHQASITYDDAEGKRVFLEHNQMCGEVDVLVAFVPEASMGTAIEMWEAYRNGKRVIAISPMSENWAVKFVCDRRYASLDEFKDAIEDGSLRRLLLAD